MQWARLTPEAPRGTSTVSTLVPPQRTSTVRLPGLPLTRLPEATPRSVHYVVTVVDRGGRCADRSPLRVLGWGPGRRLEFTVEHGVIRIVADPDGPFMITRQGHLRFPAATRRRCGMKVAEPVLLAALPTTGALLAYPAATLDTMIRARWPLTDDPPR